MMKHCCYLFFAFVLSGYHLFAYAADKKAEPVFLTAVETAIAKQQVWQQQIHTTGTIAATQGITVKSEIAGRITRLLFTPGQMVAQGAALIQLNPAILEAQLAAAQAELALSKADYQRAQQLFAKKLYAKAELDKLQATLNKALANVALAKAKLDQTLIRAPFSGRLGLNYVNVGEYVTPGQNMVPLQAIDPVRVDFNVPEIYLQQVSLNQPVTIKLSAYPQQSFIGSVSAIDALINPSNRSLAVRANVPNQAHKLLPGAFVEVELTIEKPHLVITIPQTAIVYDEVGNYVYRVIDNKAIKTRVKLGMRLQQSDIVIEEGIKAGDMIVTAGQMKLKDQMPITMASQAAG